MVDRTRALTGVTDLWQGFDVDDVGIVSAGYGKAGDVALCLKLFIAHEG